MWKLAAYGKSNANFGPTEIGVSVNRPCPGMPNRGIHYYYYYSDLGIRCEFSLHSKQDASVLGFCMHLYLNALTCSPFCTVDEKPVHHCAQWMRGLFTFLHNGCEACSPFCTMDARPVHHCAQWMRGLFAILHNGWEACSLFCTMDERPVHCCAQWMRGLFTILHNG